MDLTPEAHERLTDLQKSGISTDFRTRLAEVARRLSEHPDPSIARMGALVLETKGRPGVLLRDPAFHQIVREAHQKIDQLDPKVLRERILGGPAGAERRTADGRDQTPRDRA